MKKLLLTLFTFGLFLPSVGMNAQDLKINDGKAVISQQEMATFKKLEPKNTIQAFSINNIEVDNVELVEEEQVKYEFTIRGSNLNSLKETRLAFLNSSGKAISWRINKDSIISSTNNVLKIKRYIPLEDLKYNDYEVKLLFKEDSGNKYYQDVKSKMKLLRNYNTYQASVASNQKGNQTLKVSGVTLTDLDAKNTRIIKSSEKVAIVVDLKGYNLEQAKSFKLAGEDLATGKKIFWNVNKDSIDKKSNNNYTITRVIRGLDLNGKDYKMSFVINDENQDNYPIVSSQEIADNMKEPNPLQYYTDDHQNLHVSGQNFIIKNLDGKKSVADFDGKALIKINIQGMDLNNIKSMQIVGKEAGSSDQVWNINSDSLNLSLTNNRLDIRRFLSFGSFKGHDYELSLKVTSQKATTSFPINSSEVINSNQIHSTKYKTEVSSQANDFVHIKGMTKLIVGAQTKTPKYLQNTKVTAKQLANQAGIVYSGDAPIEVIGSVNTSQIGLQNTSIKFTETTGDKESKTVSIKYNVATDQSYTINNLDGQKSVADFDGKALIKVEINGLELNKIKSMQIVGKEAGSSDRFWDLNADSIDLNAANTTLKIRRFIKFSNFKDHDYALSLKITSEKGEKLVPINSSKAINSTQKSGTNYLTQVFSKVNNIVHIKGSGSANIPLTISDQDIIHTYQLDEKVIQSQLVIHSGIAIEGDDVQRGDGSYIDTSTTGEKTIKVTISERGGDKESKTIEIRYIVEDSEIDLDVSAQEWIPTYLQNEEVNAKQLVEQAAILYFGDDPIEVTGTVDTSQLGQEKTTTIKFTETTGDHETKDVSIKYNVGKITDVLTVSEQTEIRSYSLNKKITAKQLADDSGVTYSGDSPIEITGTVDTSELGKKTTTIKFTETKGDHETKDLDIDYIIDKPDPITSEILDSLSNSRLLTHDHRPMVIDYDSPNPIGFNDPNWDWESFKGGFFEFYFNTGSIKLTEEQRKHFVVEFVDYDGEVNYLNLASENNPWTLKTVTSNFFNDKNEHEIFLSVPKMITDYKEVRMSYNGEYLAKMDLTGIEVDIHSDQPIGTWELV